MQNWKRAVVFGSLGAGAFLLLSGRRNAGIGLAAVGAAVLASEYPEQLERLWRNAPEYLSRGGEIVQAISRIGQRLAEESQRYGIHAFHQAEREGYVS